MTVIYAAMAGACALLAFIYLVDLMARVVSGVVITHVEVMLRVGIIVVLSTVAWLLAGLADLL